MVGNNFHAWDGMPQPHFGHVKMALKEFGPVAVEIRIAAISSGPDEAASSHSGRFVVHLKERHFAINMLQ